MCRWRGFFLILGRQRDEHPSGSHTSAVGSGDRHSNCCHIGFCKTLLMPCRRPIGHGQESTKFLFIDENGCGDTYSWRITHFLWKTSWTMQPSVTVSSCSLPLQHSTLCSYQSHDNTRPSPGQNLTLCFLCGCNESIKDCTVMSYSGRE